MGHLSVLMRGRKVRNAHMIQYFGHGVANPCHHEADLACLYIPAISAWPESRAACASQRRQRPVDHANDGTDPYFARSSSKHVAASRSLLAEDNSSMAKVAQNCIKEFFRDVVRFGNFACLHPRPRLERGKAYEGL